MIVQNNSNNLAFKARFLQNIPVLKFNYKTKNYDKVLSSFVEFDPKNIDDAKALSEVVNYWENDKYACCILNGFEYCTKNLDKCEKYKIFALTSQKNNYDKLISDELLGLAQMDIEDGQTHYLSYLQVKPAYIEQYNILGNRIYKGIGSGILSALKKIYNSISLRASNSGLDSFYKKNNFDLMSKSERKYLWKE